MGKTTVDGSLHQPYFLYVKAATAEFSNVTVHKLLLLSSFILVYFCVAAAIMSFLSFSSVPPNKPYICTYVCLNTCIHACCGSSCLCCAHVLFVCLLFPFIMYVMYILYAFYTNLQYHNYLLHIIIFDICASPYVIPSPIYIIPACVPSNCQSLCLRCGIETGGKCTHNESAHLSCHQLICHVCWRSPTHQPLFLTSLLLCN